jgi:thioesterase domain-containing protein/acyl carrier protein
LDGLWRNLLNLPTIGVDEDFFELGGHSLLAVRLFSDIEKRFGVALPLSSLFKDGTIRNQARLLTEEPSARAWTPIVPLKPTGTRPPFFLVHGIGGEVLSFQALAKNIGPDQPVFGIQANTQEGPGFFTTVEDIAAIYLRAMRTHAPRGPYRLGGYSSGAIVAFEMARALRTMGEEVSALLILDGTVPNARPPRASLLQAWRFLANVAYWVVDDEFFSLSRRDQLVRLKGKLRAMAGPVVQATRNGGGPQVDIRDRLGLWRMPKESAASLEAHFNMINAYRPHSYPGKITVLRARAHALLASPPPDLGWGALARDGVRVMTVPGDHDSILKEPHVRVLGAMLDGLLRESS